MFLLVHDHFVVGTVCKSSAHDATFKLRSFCPRFMTHEFKPAEFHAACCEIFRKTGDVTRGNCRYSMSLLHISATCPAPSVCRYFYSERQRNKTKYITNLRATVDVLSIKTYCFVDVHIAFVAVVVPYAP